MLDGEITVKLGDDVLTLGPRDAVLIPAGDGARRAQRRRRAGGVRDGLGQGRADQIAESAFHEDFWPAG